MDGAVEAKAEKIKCGGVGLATGVVNEVVAGGVARTVVKGSERFLG